MSQIAQGLEHLALPIASLTPDPRNARRHSDRNLAAIVESLKRYGQRKPVVVQRQGMIVRAGNGTMVAAQALGWTHLAALIVDENDIDAQGFALADNRTAELAEWDYEELTNIIRDLHTAEVDVGGLGWADFELDPMLKAEWAPPATDESYLGPARSAGAVVSQQQIAPPVQTAQSGRAQDAPPPIVAEAAETITRWIGLTAEQAEALDAVKVSCAEDGCPEADGDAVAWLIEQAQ